jgi:branched-chain amino acid transport system permease protein
VAFSPAYLPSQYSFYAIIVTFALLALVLASRPYGLFGRPA